MSEDTPDNDPELDALIADALARRGDLPPTTTAEVRRAEVEGVAFEGELPPELARLRRPATEISSGAASQRVVSLDEVRRGRERAATRTPWLGYAATFALGAAAAAAVFTFGVGRDPAARLTQEPAGSPQPSAASSATPEAPVVAIDPVRVCGDECCAGSACAAAKGELKTCPTERTCISCVEGGGKDAFRLRMGNLLPTENLDPKMLPGLDLCARVGGSPWSCEPAYLDATARPAGRTLPIVAPAEDLATSVELELRPRGGAKVFGAWRSGIKIGPNVLCRGVGVVIKSDKDEHLGGLSLFLEDAHYVELARSADRAALLEHRARLRFADVIPSLVETSKGGGERFALVVGPLDRGAAERLAQRLAEKGEPATPSFGADLVGSPEKLPDR